MSEGSSRTSRVVVAITGASGAVYAVRLLQILGLTDLEIHLTISPSGSAVIRQELQIEIDPRKPGLGAALRLLPTLDRRFPATDPDWPRPARELADRIRFHQYDDYMDADRERLVPDAGHGRLSLQRKHAERHRASGRIESDSTRRRGPSEGTSSADPGPPRNAAQRSADREHASVGPGRGGHPSGDAGVVPRRPFARFACRFCRQPCS